MNSDQSPESKTDAYWLQVGTYHVSEAWRFFKALEQEGVRFQFTPYEVPPDAVAMAYGGFGQGSQLIVEVWSEDANAFHDIHCRYFDRDSGVTPEEREDEPPPQDDWRNRLR